MRYRGIEKSRFKDMFFVKRKGFHFLLNNEGGGGVVMIMFSGQRE